MTDFWHTFENTFGSDLVATIAEQPFVIPLSKLSIIDISGEDASGFLQNLLTNDVNQLGVNQGQLTALCNPKGRVIGLFWLIKKQDDQFLALMPHDTAAILQKRLSMFVLRSKVTIENKTDSYAAFALSSEIETAETITLSTKLDLKLIIIEQSTAIETLQQLTSDQTQLCAASVWESLLINAGIPSVYEKSSEAFTPQQINLDVVSGVSFQKGCYPGQEVVARLHYLGSPSRRLFLANYQGDKSEANSVVTDNSGNTVGHLVSSSAEKDGLALLSLKLSDIDQALYLNSDQLTNIKALAESD